MAAGNWNMLLRAKRKFKAGAGVSFSGGAFRIALYKGTANLSNTLDVSTKASITNQLAATRGYGVSGRLVSNTGVTVTATTGVKFSGDGVCWSANGGNLGSTASLQYAVLVKGASNSGLPVGYVTLSTAAFAVGDGSALQINGGQAGSGEIFVLT